MLPLTEALGLKLAKKQAYSASKRKTAWVKQAVY